MKYRKIIKCRVLEDRISEYIGFCTNPTHYGIVRYSFYRTCEKRRCKYYQKYRPENVQSHNQEKMPEMRQT